MVRPIAERFWAKVDQAGPIPDFRPDLGPCWLWTGAAARDYGHLYVSRAVGVSPAHRVGYELLMGPIPDRLELDHLCRVRLCVNPTHLEPVTSAENKRRVPDRSAAIAGMRAHYAAITHCPRGHPYDEANTVRHHRGGRQCRECKRANDRDRDARRRAA